MGGIFVSYRRDETAGHAGRLYADLLRHFGPAQVFRDVDSLEPGLKFPDALERAVGASDVLLAVIGKQWLTVRDSAGARRLDDPTDYVRQEIEAALRRGMVLVPVLVQGAAMPTKSELPPALAPLADWQAQELSESRWDYDVGRLITVLERHGLREAGIPATADGGGTSGEGETTRGRGAEARSAGRRLGLASLLVFVLLVGGFIFAAVQGARSFSEQAARSEIRFWLDCEVNLGTTQCTRSFGPLERRVDDCASNPLLGRDTCERLVREERAALQQR